MHVKTVRLFDNDALESLTRVHPIVPLLFWSPVILYLLWQSVSAHELSIAQISMLVIPGILTWSITEYWVHRIPFHYPAKSAFGKRVVFLYHGVHHAAPNDKTRLVMPPAGGVLVMVVLWFLFAQVIPAPWLQPFFAFFILGYLIYDYLHYATHHFRMKSPMMAALTRHHLKHHFASDKTNFGVSSPLWDWVFGTLHRIEKRSP